MARALSLLVCEVTLRHHEDQAHLLWSQSRGPPDYWLAVGRPLRHFATYTLDPIVPGFMGTAQIQLPILYFLYLTCESIGKGPNQQQAHTYTVSTHVSVDPPVLCVDGHTDYPQLMRTTLHMIQEPWLWNCESPQESVQRMSQHHLQTRVVWSRSPKCICEVICDQALN